MSERITQERLKELYEYDPETGYFIRLVSRSNRVKVGRVINAPDGKGYAQLKIDGVTYRQARLAYLYMTGEIPPIVDHINRDKLDNRWSNLRPADHSLSSWNRGTFRNNTSGITGVRKRGGRWLAYIKESGKQRQIGSYSTMDEAVAARKKAKQLREALGDKSPC